MNTCTLGSQWARYKQLQTEQPALFQDNGPIHIVVDEEIVRNYQQSHHRTIGVVYESPYNLLLVDLVYEEEGHYFTYERLVPTVQTGAIVSLPLYKGKVLLLKQYRHALRDYQYALPRGFGEKDLTPEQNLEKELGEEVGGKVINTEYLGEVIPDSGVQSSKVSVFACELSSYDKKTHSEGICEILEIDLHELDQIIYDGKITDGFTLAAISLYHSKKNL